MELTKVFRLDNGDRAEITVRLEQGKPTRSTVRHGDILPYGYTHVSISGEVAPKGVRFGTNASSYGQVVREDMPTKLRRVWERWHLNGMRAGCEHQGPGSQLGDTCPSGYGYGTAWLVDPLTIGGAQEILALFDAPIDTIIIARDGVVIDIVPSGRVLETMHGLVSYSMIHAVRNERWTIEHLNGQPAFSAYVGAEGQSDGRY